MLLKGIIKIGMAIEQQYNNIPQDIEGCYTKEKKFYVVQTRPQV